MTSVKSKCSPVLEAASLFSMKGLANNIQGTQMSAITKRRRWMTNWPAYMYSSHSGLSFAFSCQITRYYHDCLSYQLF